MPGYSDPGFDTLALHAGRRARPGHRRARRADPPDHLLRLRVQRPRGGAVQPRARRPRLSAASATRPTRCSSSACRRSKAASAPSPRPAARPRCTCRIATLMGAGSHIVASTALYGGSQNLLHYTLRRFGIETTFVKPGDIDGWRAAIRPNTRLLFGETVGNPGLDVLDIPTVVGDRPRSRRAAAGGLHPHLALAASSRSSTAPTWSTTRPPSSCRGHGTVIGGVVVDGGSFDWDRSRQIPRADPSPTTASTTWCSPRSPPSAPSCCARAARACATSAPA